MESCCHLWLGAPKSRLFLSWPGFSIKWRSLLAQLCTTLLNLYLTDRMLLPWVCSKDTTIYCCTLADVPMASIHRCFQHLLLLAPLVKLSLHTLCPSSSEPDCLPVAWFLCLRGKWMEQSSRQLLPRCMICQLSKPTLALNFKMAFNKKIVHGWLILR